MSTKMSEFQRREQEVDHMIFAQKLQQRREDTHASDVKRHEILNAQLYALETCHMQVSDDKAALERNTAGGEDAELDKKGEQQLKRQEELTVGTMVRRKDLAKGKAELKGALKMHEFARNAFAGISNSVSN